MKRRMLAWIMTLVMVFTGLISLASPVTASAAAPRAISVDGPRVVARGKSIQLKALVLPPEASQKVTWRSENEKIAKVSAKGKVTGVRAGKVKITVVSKKDSSVKGSLTIEVKAKPVKSIVIRVPAKELDLNGRKTETLKAIASPSSAAQKFTWKSSNPRVAKVDEKGKVTALKKGTSTITATAVDGSGKKKTVTITVTDSRATVTPTPAPTLAPGPEVTETPAPEPTTPETDRKYFALLIGNGSGYLYLNPLDAIYYDIKGLKNALAGMSQNWKITAKENLTVAEMKSAISTAYAGATANDVCLFFYSGHGDNSTGSTAGSLCGIECTTEGVTGLLLPTDLRDCLKAAAPGRVIVVLDSCGSGSTIYSGSSTEKSSGSPKNFTRAVVNVFRGETIRDYAKTGELLDVNKFSVLAAAKHGTTSQGMYVTQQSLNSYLNGNVSKFYKDGSAFSYAIVKAMGYNFPDASYNGSMGGDSNGDGRLTLTEAYNSIRGTISSMKKIWKDFVIKVNGYWSDEYDYFAQETQMSGTGESVLFVH